MLFLCAYRGCRIGSLGAVSETSSTEEVVQFVCLDGITRATFLARGICERDVLSEKCIGDIKKAEYYLQQFAYAIINMWSHDSVAL